MERKLKPFGSYKHGKWLAETFVRGIGRQKIEEVVTTFMDTKGVKYVASSLSGTGLDALAIKCR